MNMFVSTLIKRILSPLEALNGQKNRLQRMKARKTALLNCSTILDLVERMRERITNDSQCLLERKAILLWSSLPVVDAETELLRHFYLQPGSSFLRDEYSKNRLAAEPISFLPHTASRP
jgi:hypothetical protein